MNGMGEIELMTIEGTQVHGSTASRPGTLPAHAEDIHEIHTAINQFGGKLSLR